jgi:hypothetical protein
MLKKNEKDVVRMDEGFVELEPSIIQTRTPCLWLQIQSVTGAANLKLNYWGS